MRNYTRSQHGLQPVHTNTHMPVTGGARQDTFETFEFRISRTSHFSRHLSHLAPLAPLSYHIGPIITTAQPLRRRLQLHGLVPLHVLKSTYCSLVQRATFEGCSAGIVGRGADLFARSHSGNLQSRLGPRAFVAIDFVGVVVIVARRTWSVQVCKFAYVHV